MGMFNKLTMFGFADFYHRFAGTGLTMEEMLINFMKYNKEPRDIRDPIAAPAKLRQDILKLKPPHSVMRKVLKVCCEIGNVTQDEANSKVRSREFVMVRQWVCYVGVQLGYEPADFLLILEWERTGIYHRVKTAANLLETDTEYRIKVNEILRIFGCEPFNA